MQIVKIKSIKRIPTTDRYDLTVNTTHNFFANGILIHNTSGISARVLCNPNAYAKWYEKAMVKVMNFFGSKASMAPVYDYIYASRTVIKNQYYNKKAGNGFYGVDVWKYADDILKPLLQKGMTA